MMGNPVSAHVPIPEIHFPVNCFPVFDSSTLDFSSFYFVTLKQNKSNSHQAPDSQLPCWELLEKKKKKQQRKTMFPKEMLHLKHPQWTRGPCTVSVGVVDFCFQTFFINTQVLKVIRSKDACIVHVFTKHLRFSVHNLALLLFSLNLTEL